VAVGPGKPVWNRHEKRMITPEMGVELGDVVLYSRKFGSRLGKVNRFKTPGYNVPLNVRVFSIDQIIAVVEDFRPWWDVEESQLDPSGTMTG
jgi:hypothetical protein